MSKQKEMFVRSLLFAGFIALGLFTLGAVRNQSYEYWYLIYNLILGVIPIGLAVAAAKLLKTRRWQDWRVNAVTFLWLLFLPNSFYIVSDFIHLPETTRADILQDSVMLMQFSVIGLVLGFLSLHIVQQAYRRHINDRFATPAAILILFLCSFAIYLGRDLRWNSWDILTNPLLLFQDMISVWFDPLTQVSAIMTTFSFFFMLVSFYVVMQCGIAVIKRHP